MCKTTGYRVNYQWHSTSETHKLTAVQLKTLPSWKIFPGYAFGMPQPSMAAKEYFSSGSNTIATTTAFLDVVERMVEFYPAAALSRTKIMSDLDSATASAIAAATCCLQISFYIPVVTEYKLQKASDVTHKDHLIVILPWSKPEITKATYTFCVDLWNRLAAGERFSNATLLREKLHAHIFPFLPNSVNQYSLVRSITKLGINLIRLPDNVLCLGTGVRSRWIESTTTEATSGISLKIARNKLLTAEILRRSGLPVPESSTVSNADDAVKVAQKFDCAVVVKPIDLDRGLGVVSDLRNEAEIRDAYQTARSLSRSIMVEKMVPGLTHRLTVVKGEVISVRQRIPGGVTGDGFSTISELVANSQATERSKRWQLSRGEHLICLDKEAIELLRREGLSPNSILNCGQFLRLRRRDNINAGGENLDLNITNVHKENLSLAVSAARALRLDIAGVDLITKDITQSWRNTGACICEVNGKPQFASNRNPEIVTELILRTIGHDPHVPAQLIISSDNYSKIYPQISQGKFPSTQRTISTKEGLWREGVLLTRSFINGYSAAIAAATRNDTQSMICVMSIRDLLFLGSPLRRWESISIQYPSLSQEERTLVPNILALLDAVQTSSQINESKLSPNSRK